MGSKRSDLPAEPEQVPLLVLLHHSQAASYLGPEVQRSLVQTAELVRSEPAWSEPEPSG